MAKAVKKKAAKKPANETKSVISRERASTYKVSDVKTASGKRKSVDNDDETARMLRGKSREDLVALAKRHGLEDRLKKWKDLNEGMFRMTFGNALRAVLRHKAEKTKERKKAA